jgi:tetratricopeptide (TPR) repeat protein
MLRIFLVLLILCPLACSKPRVELKPTNTYVLEGIMHERDREYDLAVRSYDEAIRLSPQEAAPYAHRGHAHAAQGHLDQAIHDCSEAIQRDARHEEAYKTRGLTYLAKQEYDHAIADLTLAVGYSADNPLAYDGRGRAYAAKGNAELAIRDFTEAIRLEPEFSSAYYHRAAAYLQKREHDKVITDLTQAIRLDPDLAPAYAVLAWELGTAPQDRLRDGKKAIEYATKACELSKWKNAYHLGTLAAAYAEHHEFKQATKWQKEAIRIGYDNPQAAEEAQHQLTLYESNKPFREQ